MNKEVFNGVNNVFRKVFQNPRLEIKPVDAASDIPGWDSLTHMTLINELETFFQITFTFDEVRELKNIGDILNLISKKTS